MLEIWNEAFRCNSSMLTADVANTLTLKAYGGLINKGEVGENEREENDAGGKGS